MNKLIMQNLSIPGLLLFVAGIFLQASQSLETNALGVLYYIVGAYDLTLLPMNHPEYHSEYHPESN